VSVFQATSYVAGEGADRFSLHRLLLRDGHVSATRGCGGQRVYAVSTNASLIQRLWLPFAFAGFRIDWQRCYCVLSDNLRTADNVASDSSRFSQQQVLDRAAVLGAAALVALQLGPSCIASRVDRQLLPLTCATESMLIRTQLLTVSCRL
jgi:hypothetical protein